MISRPPARARAFDLLKATVAVILLLVIVMLLLRPRQAPAQVAPTIATVSTSADGHLTANGHGQPGVSLELWAGGTSLGFALVRADGSWIFDGQITAGDYQLVALHRDSVGNTLSASEPARFRVAAPASTIPPSTLVPTAPPTAVPAVAPVPTTASTATTAITAVPTRTVAPAATDAPLTATPVAAPVRLDSPQLRPDGTITLSGTGGPGSVVELWANDSKLGEATAGADGTWSFSGQLTPGDYRLTARTVDAGGQTLNESAAQVVTLASQAPTALPATPSAPALGDGQAYIVKQGDLLSQIAFQFYGDLSLYTRIVEGTNAKAAQDSSFARITDPGKIEIGQKLWIPGE